MNNPFKEAEDLKCRLTVEGSGNRVAFCTLPYSPKLCSLYVGESHEAEWTPPPGFINKERVKNHLNSDFSELGHIQFR